MKLVKLPTSIFKPATRPCSKPIELTSIATSSMPDFFRLCKFLYSETMSGVVSDEFCSWIPRCVIITPREPIDADFFPRNSRIWRVNSAMEVLPLVPVMA